MQRRCVRKPTDFQPPDLDRPKENTTAMTPGLQVRKLRCHYDGFWIEGIRDNYRTFKYINGSYLDTTQDGEEVSVLDLQAEMGKVLLIPRNVKWRWYWLNGDIRIEIKSDSDFMYMWKNLKVDNDGHSHLYFEFTKVFASHPPPQINRQQVYNALFEEDEVIEGIRKVRQYNIDNVDADEVCVEEEEEEDEKDYEEPNEYHVDVQKDIVEDDEVDNQHYNMETGDMEWEFPWQPNDEVQELQMPKPKPDDMEMNLIAKCFDAERDEDEENGVDAAILSVGQCFKDVYKARDHLRLHAIRTRFRLWLKKNEQHFLDARCKCPSSPNPCVWRCLVRRTNDGHTFRIRKVNAIHTCVGLDGDKNPSVDSRWISSQLEVQMKLHHKSYSPHDIVKEMWHTYQLEVSYWQAWHSRVEALEKVYGSYDESYLKVPEMCRQILLTNPDSIAKFSTLEHFQTFTSVCIAFKASLDGFIAGCRPLVGLDGCFLKGKYGGALLSMVALDGNNGIFPLAIYIGRGENKENWTKFLQIMEPHLVRHPENLTFISDRQKGLIQAIPEVFPMASQRFCFRHVYQNFKDMYRGFADLAWGASRCYKKSRFNHLMANLEGIDKDAAAYLKGVDSKLWARSHFDHVTCSDHNTNNFSEAFNAFIMDARDKPIVLIVKKIQRLMRSLVFERNQLSSGWDDDGLVPRVVKDINTKLEKVRHYILGGSSPTQWEVTSSTSSWNVDLEKKTCSCMEWQIVGIPCQHAVCVIHRKRGAWPNYCSPYFKNKAFKATYNGAIVSMNPEEDWDEPRIKCLPPLKQRQPGRPTKNRKRAQGENDKGKNLCPICKVYGHNSRTCKYGPKGGNTKDGLPLPPLPPRPTKQPKKVGRPRTIYRHPELPIGVESPNARSDSGQTRGRGANRGSRGRGARGRGARERGGARGIGRGRGANASTTHEVPTFGFQASEASQNTYDPWF